MQRPANFSRRGALLLAIVTAHVIVMMWLIAGGHSQAIVRSSGLNVFAVARTSGQRASAARPPARAASPPPSLVPVVVLPSKRPQHAAPSSQAAQAIQAEAAPSGGCSIGRDIGQAIGQSPAAMAELDALPPTVRTAADAVMVWDGHWTDLGSVPSSATPTGVRAVVSGVIANAVMNCRAARANGPEFIPVRHGYRTVMLVIGSGAWRWNDLLTPGPDCLHEPATCVATIPPRPA